MITHPEDSYRLWRFVVCDQETSSPARGLQNTNPKRAVAPEEKKLSSI